MRTFQIYASCSTCSIVSSQGVLKPRVSTHQLRGHQAGWWRHSQWPRHRQQWWRRLLKHVVPRFGLPLSTQSDNGPAFISQVTQQVSGSLTHHQDHLIKLSLELRSSWVDLLLWALMRIRATPHKPLGLNPFELMYGQPFLVTHQFLQSLLPWLTIYLI